MRLLPFSAALLALLASAASLALPPSDDFGLDTTTRPEYPNRVLLIRHGEKPKDGGVGLSRAGQRRAQCVRKVFGAKGRHNIGLVIAQDFNARTGVRKRPYDTVKPLADDLGLEVHTDCERDDPECIRRLVADFAKRSKKDVLICWKHSFLHEIAHALGAHKTSPYPDKRYDIVWTIQHKVLVKKESQHCQGLDEGLGGHHDRDTEIEEAGIDLDDLDLDFGLGEDEGDWWMDEAGEQLVLGDA